MDQGYSHTLHKIVCLRVHENHPYDEVTHAGDDVCDCSQCQSSAIQFLKKFMCIHDCFTESAADYCVSRHFATRRVACIIMKDVLHAFCSFLMYTRSCCVPTYLFTIDDMMRVLNESTICEKQKKFWHDLHASVSGAIERRRQRNEHVLSTL
jgi:hypothetical protein